MVEDVDYSNLKITFLDVSERGSAEPEPVPFIFEGDLDENGFPFGNVTLISDRGKVIIDGEYVNGDLIKIHEVQDFYINKDELLKYSSYIQRSYESLDLKQVFAHPLLNGQFHESKPNWIDIKIFDDSSWNFLLTYVDDQDNVTYAITFSSYVHPIEHSNWTQEGELRLRTGVYVPSTKTLYLTDGRNWFEEYGEGHYKRINKPLFWKPGAHDATSPKSNIALIGITPQKDTESGLSLFFREKLKASNDYFEERYDLMSLKGFLKMGAYYTELSELVIDEIVSPYHAKDLFKFSCENHLREEQNFSYEQVRKLPLMQGHIIGAEPLALILVLTKDNTWLFSKEYFSDDGPIGAVRAKLTKTYTNQQKQNDHTNLKLESYLFDATKNKEYYYDSGAWFMKDENGELVEIMHPSIWSWGHQDKYL